ncbi:molybdate ABC transporter permease subunit [Spirulina sp. 06S082]|uniref:molybdate ABC transporter permease subunit n=1 Tax=Spirulina sp. 06S082 TaxID=3110248 RepID=UPI002B20141F|nr:molybdate ABC transporter permease subunit [Spirulina sp. 06S082]MEA5470917.1 molybdate ABC transporter permease subunit [Spirulina sp. 06S082]
MEFDLFPLWISLKTALVATIFAFVAGISAAGWMFGYKGKERGFIDGIFTLPLVLPPTVVGFLLLLLLGRNSPVGILLQKLGIVLIFSWPATVIAASVVAFPLMYKTVLGAFKQVDRHLIDCARTLGASEQRIFWQILLPLAWPGVVGGTILSFARALGEFGATLMLAGSIPGKTQTIPIAIFLAAEAGKMDKALIWTIVMIAIALLAIAAINYGSDSPNLAQSRLTNQVSFLIGRWSSIVGRWFNFSRPYLMVGKSNAIAEEKIRETPSELNLNLYKKLAGFALNTQVTTNGKPLGILGASGSGKSMTLRCIAGLETPTEGRIVLNGRVLFDSKKKINLPSRSRRIGFVFQNYALFPHMRVARNIGFGLQDLPKEKRQQRVQKYLELMNLQGLERRYPRELSGGQQQRVALARALATAPEALLLDEPLSALDTYLRTHIERLLIEVFSTYQGVTLFVTHKLEEAYRVCDRLLILHEGRVIASGRKEDIFEHPATLTVAKLTECKNFSRVRAIDPQRVEALDWGCSLHIVEPIPPSLDYIGIRAHHLTFIHPSELQDSERKNVFPCWLVSKSETQHQMTLYLRLNSPPEKAIAYHLQGEVFKEKWQELKDRAFPWYVYLEPLRLILMTRESPIQK